MPGPGHFIIAAGVTNDPSIPKVADDLRLIVDYFTKELGYQHALPQLMDSPTANTFREELSDWFDAQDRHLDDQVVLYFSGHGEIGPAGRHYLLLSGSKAERLDGTAFETVKLATIPFEAGRIKKLLVILDTCYSGTGLAAAAAEAWQTLGEGTLLQIISASRKRELALDGVFACKFIEAIRNTTTVMGRRVQEYLGFGSIVTQVKLKLPEFQQATCACVPGQPGDSLSPIRNPRSDAFIPPGLDLEDQEHYQRDLLTHAIPRAQGGEILAPQSNIWYFTGRKRALQAICEWIKAKRAASRLLAVTGRPGAGKSAVLGRLVTLADPSLRDGILRQHQLPEETIPPVRAFDTFVHLRGRGVREVGDILVKVLSLEPLDTRLRDDEIGTSLGQSLAGRKRSCCLVFDALDEAERPKEMWRDFLRLLSGVTNVRVIIGARPLFDWGAGLVIDLSDREYASDSDIADYVERRLLAAEEPNRWTPYREKAELARQVAKAVASRADGVFLVARIVSSMLIEAADPIDTSADGWEQRIPSNTREAFEEYLEQFGEINNQVRDVLLPLAFAEGHGLPWESIWAPLASALSGRHYGDADIRGVLEKAGPFVIEGQENGRSVYRLYHQELVDFFVEAERGRKTEIQKRFVEVLKASVPAGSKLDADYSRAHPYVLRHLAAHAAKADLLDEVVTNASFLIACVPASLVPWLWHVGQNQARRWRDCYQIASHQLIDVPLEDRVSLLERTARQQGFTEVAAAVAALRGAWRWCVPWAVWHKATSHLTLRGHEDSVLAVAVAEQGGRPLIVSGSGDQTVRVWDLETGEGVGEPLRGHEGSVRAVAVAEHGGRRLIVSGSDDHTVRVWDLRSHRLLSTIDLSIPVRSVACSAASLIAGCNSGLIRIDLGRI